jgi:lysyl-tRNA synthetase class 2
MRIDVEPEVFERFPGFRRAVVVATGVDNRGEPEELSALLRECEASVRADPGLENYRACPRIAVWMEVFSSMGLNPNRFPPSIANLIKRTRAGRDLPFINKLVTIFNCVSLKHQGSCGGDDLAAVEGDLRLGFADGTETYIPLGQPEATEHPKPGEVIYYDRGNGNILCRAWCWKNGDPTKIRPETERVAINLDGMTHLGERELLSMAEELADLVRRHCGGETGIHLLSPERVSFEAL